MNTSNMKHWIIIFAIIFGFAKSEDLLVNLFGRCSYTGDPHLIPFSSSPNQPSNTYFCHQNHWEILLQNQWVLVVVYVGPSPYVILDYLIIFYDGNFGIKCVLIGSSGLSTCPISSTIISLTSGTTWNHWYPAAQFLNIRVSRYTWGSNYRYDIVIQQTYSLIQQSTGLCVKNNCTLESLTRPPIPIILPVCNIYIGAVPEKYITAANKNLVNLVRIGCVLDLTLSFDINFAHTAVSLLIHSSLEKPNRQNFQQHFLAAEAAVRKTIAKADKLAAAMIRRNNTCWERTVCLSKVDP